MMGATKIEWADRVWNPVTGCSHAGTPGCDHCYAKRMAARLAGRAGYSQDGPFRVTIHMDRMDDPIRLKKPSRIFVCSMGDLFHKDVPASVVEDVYDVMGSARQHTFIVLTKRPENVMEKLYGQADGVQARLLGGGDYLENVWLGVTAENQAAADERIPLLLQVPAAKRFVSCEPLLGPIDVSLSCWGEGKQRPPVEVQGAQLDNRLGGLDWIIAGGETGPGARPMDPQWARALRDECREAGVPFFFKRMGGKNPDDRTLDGREWNDFPAVA
jgi:protein gp37